MQLKHKVAVVTGSGRGIGRAIAIALAKEGARIVVNDIGADERETKGSIMWADKVVHEIVDQGGTAIASYDTVATAEGGTGMIETAIGHYGKLDILVNNAGIIRDHMIFNMTEDEWDAVVKVHLYGHFYCIKAACVWFRQQRGGGRIINVSSEAGLGDIGTANYAAAKEGIVGFTRAVARDMGRYGVTCNVIRPRTRSQLMPVEKLQASFAKARAAGITFSFETAVSDLERPPEDIAPFVVYLATDEASFINGYDFVLAGGRVSVMSQPQPTRTIYKEGRWTLQELADIVPKALMADLPNPAPAIPKAHNNG